MSIERCDKHAHYDTDMHTGCPRCENEYQSLATLIPKWYEGGSDKDMLNEAFNQIRGLEQKLRETQYSHDKEFALRTAQAAAVVPSEVTHICGISGWRPYPPYNDPPCPACTEMNALSAARREGGEG